MPEITGFWKDLGLGPIGEVYAPRLAFRLSSPAVTADGNLIFTDPNYVVPNLSTGYFSATVPRTDTMWPTDPSVDELFILVTAEWLEDSDDPLSGFSKLACRIKVPAAGGSIGDLVKIVVANDKVHISPTANDSDIYSGFQMNTVTGVLYMRVD